MAYPDRVVAKLVTASAISIALLALPGVSDVFSWGVNERPYSPGKSRRVRLNGAVVSSLIPTERKLEVVRTYTDTTYAIQYTSTMTFSTQS